MVFVVMRPGLFALLAVWMVAPLSAEMHKAGRKSSLLDDDPSVVYMERHFDEAVMLRVTKEAPVFSDKDGRHKLGALKADQSGGSQVSHLQVPSVSRVPPPVPTVTWVTPYWAWVRS